jgi:hypothetical protein
MDVLQNSPGLNPSTELWNGMEDGIASLLMMNTNAPVYSCCHHDSIATT